MHFLAETPNYSLPTTTSPLKQFLIPTHTTLTVIIHIFHRPPLNRAQLVLLRNLAHLTRRQLPSQPEYDIFRLVNRTSRRRPSANIAPNSSQNLDILLFKRSDRPSVRFDRIILSDSCQVAMLGIQRITRPDDGILQAVCRECRAITGLV